MLVTGLLYIAFTMFRCVSWIPDLSKTFFMKGCQILSNALVGSSDMFEFVSMIDYSDRFPYIEHSLNPRDETYLIMVNDHFDVFLDLVCKNFIEYFCINVHEGDWS